MEYSFLKARLGASVFVLALAAALTVPAAGFGPPVTDVSVEDTYAPGQMTRHLRAWDPVENRDVVGTVFYPSYQVVGTAQIGQGVVAWFAKTGGDWEVVCCVYDPSLHQWRSAHYAYDGSGDDSITHPRISDGVACWVFASDYGPDEGMHACGAVYDPAIHEWRSYERIYPLHQISRLDGMNTGCGAIAWCCWFDSGASQIGYAIYDPTRQGWRDGESEEYHVLTGIGGPALDPRGVHWWTDYGHHYAGYDWRSGMWRWGQETTPLARFSVSTTYPEGSTPVTFWNMSLGGSTHFWDFGDGTESQQSSGVVHAYPPAGEYVAWLTVYGNGEHSCSVSIRWVPLEPSEYQALKALYDSTGGSAWINSDNWLDASRGGWYGVRTEDGCVRALHLDGNNLTGALPAAIGSLHCLEELRLDRNSLAGPIPSQIGGLSNLRILDLSGNQLSGPIPTELGGLERLEELSLDSNQLSGPIPDTLGGLSGLKSLECTYNQFSGAIPASLGNLASLQDLELSVNRLSGPIPAELGNLANLRYLGLAYNSLSGALPPSLGNMANLDTMFLYGNRLSGSLPPALGDLAKLEWLYLSLNELSGSIPPELGNLSSLRYMNLDNNRLTGPIPAELGNLANLYTLELNNNQLSGPIPPELGRLANLSYLDASHNRLTETIPSELSQIGGLSDLKLADNQLTGNIPPGLGYLHNLTRLDLFGNQLTGTIPPELGLLSNLLSLALFDNQLSGPVPPELGDLSSLWYLQLGGNQLAGTIPSELSSLSNLRILDLSNNLLAGQIPTGLSSLSALATLGLAWNQLDGTIPPELSNLSELRVMDLSGNMLGGEIPAVLGDLAALETLNLGWNRINGAIPTQLGALENLLELDLGGNQLTGYIPPELGNLAHLEWLDLSHNDLSGPIPSQIGDMASLRDLRLSWNHLTDSPPWRLSEIPSLEVLSLDHNKLSGPVPAWLASMDSLVGIDIGSNRFIGEIPADLIFSNLEYLSLQYNRLTASTPALQAWLADKSPNWELTQTVAPSGGKAVSVGPGSVALSWTPIPYTEGGGYYEVGISSTPGGPYAFDPAHRTEDKAASQMIISGLPTGSPTYAVLRSFTPSHWHNQSDLTSLQSCELVVTAGGFSKLVADGSECRADGLVVSAVFADHLYVQKADRSFGIAVEGDSGAAVGDSVDVSGVIGTTADGERVVTNASVTVNGPGNPPTPVQMTLKALAGGPWFFDPSTGCGQRGVTDPPGRGLSTTGLLVAVTGRVQDMDPDSIYINDGAWYGTTGVRVSRAHVPAEVGLGSFVRVRGISSMRKLDSAYQLLLKPRSQNDIEVVYQP